MRISLSTLQGKHLFAWEEADTLRALSNVLQVVHPIEKENAPRQTLIGYILKIKLTNLETVDVLIYGTSGDPPVWRVAYLDPHNPAERLIKAVHVNPDALPEKLKGELEQTSLLSK